MLVIRDDVFYGYDYPEYDDTSYFKLVHDMNHSEKPVLEEGYMLVPKGPADFAEHIHECYGDGISAEELMAYIGHPVYDPELWIAVADQGTGEIVASGIAELDTGIGEGALEWIQVSPEYRRQGLGRFVVSELLWRMKGKASFVTVSGKHDSESCPLALYEACGFGGIVIWHVLTRRNKD